MNNDLTVESRTLEVLKFGMLQYLQRRALKGIDGEVANVELFIRDNEPALGWLADEIAIKVRALVPADHLDREVIEYPLDWWEAFKLRWAPAWFKRRWPVRTRIHKIDSYVLLPKLALYPPEYNPRIFISHEMMVFDPNDIATDV